MSAIDPLPGQLSLFPESACLVKIVPEKNQHRFYVMTVAPSRADRATVSCAAGLYAMAAGENKP